MKGRGDNTVTIIAVVWMMFLMWFWIMPMMDDREIAREKLHDTCVEICNQHNETYADSNFFKDCYLCKCINEYDSTKEMNQYIEKCEIIGGG